MLTAFASAMQKHSAIQRPSAPPPYLRRSKQSISSTSALSLSHNKSNDQASSAVSVYVGPPSPFDQKTRIICSLWSINLMLPHLLVKAFVVDSEQGRNPDVILNIDVNIFRVLHACICASEGATVDRGEDLLRVAKLWINGDGIIREEMLEHLAKQLFGVLEEATLQELKPTMDFICSLDHSESEKIASIRDIIVMRLSDQASSRDLLRGNFIPTSLLGEVLIFTKGEAAGSQLSRRPHAKLAVEKAPNANRVAWNDILKTLESSGGPSSSIEGLRAGYSA